MLQRFCFNRSLLLWAVLSGIAWPAFGQLIHQENTILPPTVETPLGALFGRSMALDDGILAVSANLGFGSSAGAVSGSAHLFDVDTQTELLRLIPNDDHLNSGFGISIDIDDGVVAVGAWLSALSGESPAGAVYLFDAVSGAQIRKFTQPNNDVPGAFGLQVAIKDGVVAISAMFVDENDPSGQDIGGYVYLYNVNNGIFLQRLSTPDGHFGDRFGGGVDMDNGRLVVGASGTIQTPGFHPNEIGAVYIFDIATGTQLVNHVPDELVETDDASGYGSRVAMSGNRVAVSAPGRGEVGNAVGSVYIYDTIADTEIRIDNPNPITQGYFGGSVAFDNDIVVVGDPIGYDEFGDRPGKVYMFNATTGQLAIELHGSDVADDHWFGHSVAIDGLHSAAGATSYGPTASDGEGAYLYFTFAGTEIAKLLPEEAEDIAFGNFGYQTAAGSGVIVVSANKNDDRGENAGSAYLFDATNGSKLASYFPDPGSTNSNFGYSLDYDSAIVAVGARDDADNGAIGGSVYLFGAFTGQRLRKIVPADAQPNDFFGASVGLDTGFNGGVLAVGASLDDDQGTTAGAVYLFNPFTGVQLNKIYADDAAAGDAFGNVLAIDDGVVAISASLDDDLGDSSGAAYLFDAGTGNQLFKLLPDDGVAGDHFGSSIAIHNGIVAVGAWQRDENGVNSGAVYLFDATTGLQIDKLVPDDGFADDRFGFSVSIYNGVVLIGACRDDIFGTWSGSSYIYGAVTGNQLYKLAPIDGVEQDLFGRSVSIHNNTIGIGAIGSDRLGLNAGIAYSFAVPADICPADFTGDRVINFFDISAFLQLFGIQDQAADINSDGVWDFFDLSVFLSAFAAGCP